MPLHLIKLAVGIEDLEHLERRQKQGRNAAGNYRHRTRMMPQRQGDVLDGGSMYWVIRGLILVRQPIVALSTGKDEHGKPLCVIELEPRQILVQPRAQRPFQGWRYLKPEDAPVDIAAGGKIYIDPTMPKAMRMELARLGLL
jgi:hypothetical protein